MSTRRSGLLLLSDAALSAPARGVSEFRKNVTFWLVLAALVGAILFAFQVWEPWFERQFEVAPKYRHVAGASLAVSAMSLVGGTISLINVLRAAQDATPIRLDVPKYLEPWLPTIFATLAGILIGTTIFT